MLNQSLKISKSSKENFQSFKRKISKFKGIPRFSIVEIEILRLNFQQEHLTMDSLSADEMGYARHAIYSP